MFGGESVQNLAFFSGPHAKQAPRKAAVARCRREDGSLQTVWMLPPALRSPQRRAGRQIQLLCAPTYRCCYIWRENRLFKIVFIVLEEINKSKWVKWSPVWFLMPAVLTCFQPVSTAVRFHAPFEWAPLPEGSSLCESWSFPQHGGNGEAAVLLRCPQ